MFFFFGRRALASNIKDMLLDLVVLEKTPRHDSQANLAGRAMLINTQAGKSCMYLFLPSWSLYVQSNFCVVFLLSLLMFFWREREESVSQKPRVFMLLTFFRPFPERNKVPEWR